MLDAENERFKISSFSYIIPKSRYIKETPQQQRILFTFGLHQDLFQRRTDDSISLV